MQDPNGARTCLACQMTDPPPSMTCHLDRDHYAGRQAGRQACGRLTAACAPRPCSAKRRTAGIADAVLRLVVPGGMPWQAAIRPGRKPGISGTGGQNG